MGIEMPVLWEGCRARGARADLTAWHVSGGCAVVRPRAGSARGWSEEVQTLLDSCFSRLGDVHVVVWLFRTGQAVDRRLIDDALLGSLAQVPQRLVGIVGRSVSCGEACLLAACDFVLCADHVALEATFGGPAAPAVPQRLLGLHGARSWTEALAAGKGSAINASQALDIGLVSETVPAADLQNRSKALISEAAKAPLEFCAAQAWAARRRAGAERGGAKRAAGQVALLDHRPPKRLAANRDVDKAVSAIVGPEGPPTAVRNLLAHAVGQSIKSPPSSQPASQRALMDRIGNVLSSSGGDLEVDFQATKADLEAVRDAQALCDANAAAQECDLEAAEDLVMEAEHRLLLVKMSRRNTLSSVNRARISQEEREAKLTQILAERKTLEEDPDRLYAPLKAGMGGSTPKAKAKEIAELVKPLRLYSFDTTLLAGLAGALGSAPDKRTDFDHKVLQCFEDAISARLGELEAQASTLRQESQQGAAELEAAKAVFRTESDKESQCNAAFREAKARARDAGAAANAHAQAVQAVRSQVSLLRANASLAKI